MTKVAANPMYRIVSDEDARAEVAESYRQEGRRFWKLLFIGLACGAMFGVVIYFLNHTHEIAVGICGDHIECQL